MRKTKVLFGVVRCNDLTLGVVMIILLYQIDDVVLK
jgi:hypothetical protein